MKRRAHHRIIRSLIMPPLDGGERKHMSCPENDLQSHRPLSWPTGQASWWPGHRTQRSMANCKVQTEVRGSNLVISKASNRSMLTAASACIPILRIDNTDTRMRNCFDNRFFAYRLTCLITTITYLYLFIIFIVIPLIVCPINHIVDVAIDIVVVIVWLTTR